jgi:hypothetical protein
VERTAWRRPTASRAIDILKSGVPDGDRRRLQNRNRYAGDVGLAAHVRLFAMRKPQGPSARASTEGYI